MENQMLGRKLNEMDSAYISRSTISFIQMPAVVVEKIVKNMTFDEMSRLRQVCNLLKAHSERLLNEGFVRLGRQLTTSTAKLKKQLPKKESERRAHPLNRYSEVFSALETRYTLLSMTYKKYIDLHSCCFIPGKVLDLAFGVIKQISAHLDNHALGQDIAPIDVINILRDIRDYSSMAMEHFEENVVPRFPNKPLAFHSFRQIAPGIPIKIPPGSFGLISQCCVTKNLNTQSDESTDEEFDFAAKIDDLRKEMRNGFEEKDRVIDEQRKELGQQRRYISSIVALLEEVGKREDWNQGFMAELDQISNNCRVPTAKMIVQKRNRQTKNKENSIIVITSENSSVKSNCKEAKKSPDYFFHDAKASGDTCQDNVQVINEEKGRYSFRKRDARGFASSVDQHQEKKQKNTKTFGNQQKGSKQKSSRI